MRRLPLLLLALLLGTPELGAQPTRGISLPGAPVAGDADASAVELNPGQLPFLDGPSTTLALSQWQKETVRPGRGAGLLHGGSLFGGLGLGLGFQWLRPTIPGEPSSYYKLQLGTGIKLSRALGLGVTWHHLFGSKYRGLDTYSVGLGFRPLSFLALGVAIHDLGRPRPFDGAPALRRTWDTELALRCPWGPGFQLAAGARFDEDADLSSATIAPRMRFALGFKRGLALYGEVERDVLDPTAPVAYRGALGLTVSFDHLGLALAGVGTHLDDDGAVGGPGVGPGASLMLRTTQTRRPPLVAGRYVARVELPGGADDRGFLATVVRLRRLADDPSVAAVLLQIDSVDLGLGRVDEVRALIARIRETKPVFAYLTQPGTREYYLATACTGIAMHPAGGLLFGGLAQTVTYYKGTMEKLGVNLDLVRIAEFKGSMEPFVATEASPPVRENRDSLLDDDFGRLVAAVAEGRRAQGLDQAAVKALIDVGLFTPAEANARMLTDATVDDDGLETFLALALGRKVSMRDADPAPFARGAWRTGRVAVILVDGAIADGKGPDWPFPTADVAWSDPIVDALDQVRRDSSVKAVVLRVNSPGGSVLASDRIARAVVKVRSVGKPVIASMGDMAASGGYYVSAPADEIFAEPSTLTGSIGIFTYKVDVNGLMDKLGVTATTFKRGEHADRFSLFRPWTDEEKRQAMAHIENMYQQFLQTVAQGRAKRGITVARANEIGRGRVWTGAQAFGLGLA